MYLKLAISVMTTQKNILNQDSLNIVSPKRSHLI